MEEDKYRATYNELAAVRCVFEKALTNNHARCRLSEHFYLADREGYACKVENASVICSELLEKLRKKSAFVFKLRDVSGVLPHNMDLRVQAGGMAGLHRLVMPSTDTPRETASVENIHGLISRAIEKYGSLEDLPYSVIIQSVEQFQGRRRRHR